MLTATQLEPGPEEAQRRRVRPLPSLKQQYRAYLMQRIEDHKDSLSREELIALILDQQRQIETLRQEVEELRRGGRGQAAPFSKGSRILNPKRPGRKPGQGPFQRRQEPHTESAAETSIQVAVEAKGCPRCGGELERQSTEIASLIDLPPRPALEVRKYQVEVRRCRQCGQRVRGCHPDLGANQHGATAHRLGPRIKAAAHLLHYVVGVPVRRVPAILKELVGVEVTQGAITQDALKQSAGPVGTVYAELRARIGQAAVVHTDDTGWRVGGQSAHLMAFDTDQAVVYQIRPHHRNEEVREIVPADYRGVLVTDRGKSYDAEELRGVAQQKCLSHLIRNVSDVLESKRGRARKFGVGLKDLLQQALQLWREQREGRALNFSVQTQEIDDALTHHLRNRILHDDDNQRLLNGIGTQHDRGHVLRFLTNPAIEPTNNRAERALRPAVIARKVSHCSKNPRGAEAFAAFVTVAQTLRKSGRSLLDSFPNLSLARSPTTCLS